jgi:alcohol dehydrogenase class IV
MVAQTLDCLQASGLAVTLFSQVKPNPIGENVEDGVKAYRAGDCDGVIPFGGGSPLDVGKAIALMVGQSRPLWDFIDEGDNWCRADPSGVAPMVAVPTTSGTGSEVGRASVIVRQETHQKCIIFHPKMLPERVICDPGLTVGLPAGLTAAVGMDALSHNLEAYCASGFHPQAVGIAVEGIRLVHQHLLTAVREGANLEARSAMMASALMGATAFQKGLGAMHALAHPIGGARDVHHGLVNAIVMPYVLEMNRPVIEPKICRLAAYMGLPSATFEAFLEWVLALRAEIGIPTTLRAVGLEAKDADWLAPLALQDPSAAGNPFPMTLENTTGLLKRALGA